MVFFLNTPSALSNGSHGLDAVSGRLRPWRKVGFRADDHRPSIPTTYALGNLYMVFFLNTPSALSNGSHGLDAVSGRLRPWRKVGFRADDHRPSIPTTYALGNL